MFDSILSGELSNFKSLEEKIFKIICLLGIMLTEKTLMSIDNKLLSTVDKNVYGNRGYKKTSIKTRYGVVEYKRRLYEIHDENGKSTKEYVFLLDEKLKMQKVGQFSQSMVDLILSTVVHSNSYRCAAETITNATNTYVSHEAVRGVTISSGKDIIKKDKELVRLNELGLLVSQLKEIAAMFEEADGLWISLQGKDRQKRIEKARKKAEINGQEFVKPKSVKTELKLHLTHEGWAKNNRHSLVNKKYTLGIMSTKDLRRIRKAKIHQRYKEDAIQLKVINGDGASWVKNLKDKGEIYQKDMLHICKCITKNVPKEYRKGVYELMKSKQYECVVRYLEWVKTDSGGEVTTIEKLQQAQYYLSDGLERYTDIVKELPKLRDGLEYRTMGNAESNIFTVLTKPFRGRKSFSILGATCLAKVAGLKVERQTMGLTDEIDAPIEIDDSVEEYIREIEENIKKMNYTKTTRKDIYEFKHSEISPKLKGIKKIVEYVPFSELIYI